MGGFGLALGAQTNNGAIPEAQADQAWNTTQQGLQQTQALQQQVQAAKLANTMAALQQQAGIPYGPATKDALGNTYQNLLGSNGIRLVQTGVGAPQSAKAVQQYAGVIDSAGNPTASASAAGYTPEDLTRQVMGEAPPSQLDIYKQQAPILAKVQAYESGAEGGRTVQVQTGPNSFTSAIQTLDGRLISMNGQSLGDISLYGSRSIHHDPTTNTDIVSYSHPTVGGTPGGGPSISAGGGGAVRNIPGMSAQGVSGPPVPANWAPAGYTNTIPVGPGPYGTSTLLQNSTTGATLPMSALRLASDPFMQRNIELGRERVVQPPEAQGSGSYGGIVSDDAPAPTLAQSTAAANPTPAHVTRLATAPNNSGSVSAAAGAQPRGFNPYAEPQSFGVSQIIPRAQGALGPADRQGIQMVGAIQNVLYPNGQSPMRYAWVLDQKSSDGTPVGTMVAKYVAARDAAAGGGEGAGFSMGPVHIGVPSGLLNYLGLPAASAEGNQSEINALREQIRNTVGDAGVQFADSLYQIRGNLPALRQISHASGSNASVDRIDQEIGTTANLGSSKAFGENWGQFQTAVGTDLAHMPNTVNPRYAQSVVLQARAYGKGTQRPDPLQ